MHAGLDGIILLFYRPFLTASFARFHVHCYPLTITANKFHRYPYFAVARCSSTGSIVLSKNNHAFVTFDWSDSDIGLTGIYQIANTQTQTANVIWKYFSELIDILGSLYRPYVSCNLTWPRSLIIYVYHVHGHCCRIHRNTHRERQIPETVHGSMVDQLKWFDIMCICKRPTLTHKHVCINFTAFRFGIGVYFIHTHTHIWNTWSVPIFPEKRKHSEQNRLHRTHRAKFALWEIVRAQQLWKHFSRPWFMNRWLNALLIIYGNFDNVFPDPDKKKWTRCHDKWIFAVPFAIQMSWEIRVVHNANTRCFFFGKL